MNQPQETGLTLTSATLQTLNKDHITDIAKHLVSEVAAGNQDAMDTLILGKKLELLAKGIVDNVKEYAYGGNYATKGNPYQRFEAKVEAADLGVEYSYDECNDPEYKKLLDGFTAAKTALDSRKKFLQALTKPIGCFDEETGEIYTINPAIKKSQSGYKITF